jgi:ribonuclease ZC3H12
LPGYYKKLILAFVFRHGKDSGVFSTLGIKLAVDYFLNRGHTQVQALVPRYRRGDHDAGVRTDNFDILDELESKGNLRYIPTTFVKGELLAPNGWGILLEGAMHFNAIIVSNDNYSGYKKEPKSQEFFNKK